MTTIDSRGNLHDGAGQFAEKHNSAPVGLTLEAGAGAESGEHDGALWAHLSPASRNLLLNGSARDRMAVLRSPEFAAASLARQLESSPAEVAQGGKQLTWLDEDGDHRRVALLDDDGELVSMTDEYRNADGWHRLSDPFGDGVERFRTGIHLDRLRADGVLVDAESEGFAQGPGHYPRHHIGGRSTGSWVNATDVARDTRAAVKRAIELGVLPGEYDYRVTTDKYSGGQAVRVGVEGMTDADHHVERHEGFPHGPSAKSLRISTVLKAVGGQWNVDRSDSSQDYFDVTYYFTVDIRDERETAFWAAERARKSKARAKG